MEKSLRKKIIIAIAIILGALVLLACLAGVLERILEGSEKGDETTIPTGEIKFSEEYVTGEFDMMSDEIYAGYDQSIHYHNTATGVTAGLEFENYDDYTEALELLFNFVEIVKLGDAESYNAFFSELYFQNHEEQESFSMQKLYDITIATYSEEEKSEDGEKYTEYIYSLEYKIRRNNGSLRSDMGSDCVRTQYFLITSRSGEWKIDNILAP